MPASKRELSPVQKLLADQDDRLEAEFDGRPLESPLVGTGPPTNLYFIQAEDGGPIKIGVALDPVARLAQLQTGNPHRLVLRRQVRVNETAERKLHTLFSAHRLTGEWFKAVPALAAIADAIPDDASAEAVAYPSKPVSAVPDARVSIGGRKDYTDEHFDRMRSDPDLGYVKPGQRRRDYAA